jgi:cyanophycinase
MMNCLLLLCLLACPAEDAASERIDSSGISGSLVICGGGALPDAILDRFVELAGGENAHLVVIPTASGRADTETDESFCGSWHDRGLTEVRVLHTRSRQEANEPDFVAPFKTATAVWISGGAQSRLAEAYVGTAVEREIDALLERGGVIGGSSAGAAIQSRLMIARGNPVPEIGVGLDLLPGAVIDQHFLKRNRKPRLLKALNDHPGHVGFGIDEGTAMVVQGRQIGVLGASTVTVCLSASENRPERVIELKSGQMEDLTALRRAAWARAAFPPITPPAR